MYNTFLHIIYPFDRNSKDATNFFFTKGTHVSCSKYLSTCRALKAILCGKMLGSSSYAITWRLAMNIHTCHTIGNNSNRIHVVTRETID